MIIFDLDNTLRHTADDQPHTPFAHGTCHKDQTNWVQWQHFANENGQPIERMVQFYELMHTVTDTIYIVTSSQFGTAEWLDSFDITQPDVICERKPGDNHSGLAYKKNYIDMWVECITLWVDDCTETCDYVESLGIPVVRVKL